MKVVKLSKQENEPPNVFYAFIEPPAMRNLKPTKYPEITSKTR